MKKRLFTFLIALMLINFVISSSAAENKIIYTAFGDSIAAGYGLDDPDDGFVSLIGKNIGVVPNNLAMSGMTSGQLLDALYSLEGSGAEETEKRVRSASLITVTIGSNDLLSKLIMLFTEAVDSYSPSDSLDYLVQQVMTKEAHESFLEGINTYKTNLPLIMDKLRELNPYAEIILTNFYNPFYGETIGGFDFGAYSDVYIKMMNDVLNEYHGERKDFYVADFYTVMNADGMTYSDFMQFNFDPHPTVKGHAALAEAISSLIDQERLSKISENIPTVIITPLESEETSSPQTAADTEKTTSSDTNSETDSEPKNTSALITGCAVAAVVLAFIVFKTVYRKKQS